ncbi:MAG: hypothetical protein EOO75_08835 [Myxococcales bacterium]|nr:MAG: hypothetical protein EOO75_08835 [Myxococcales bacterium]
MRDQHICPRCDHDEILFLPELSDQADFPLTLHAVVRSHPFRSPSRWGRLTAYICRRCGYTELYTVEPERIPLDAVPGAQLLRGTREPYRR